MTQSTFQNRVYLEKGKELLDLLKKNHRDLYSQFQQRVQQDVPLEEVGMEVARLSITYKLSKNISEAANVVRVARFLTRKHLGLPV